MTRSILAGLVLALVTTVANAQSSSAPYRQGQFPRDPATWAGDVEVVRSLLHTQADYNGFNSIQPTSEPDYVDSNYVAVGVSDVYPAVLIYNNNFGASKGDSLVVCGFRNDGEFILSTWARQVDFQFSYDRDLYPQYAWVDPYGRHALQAQVAVLYDAAGDWHQVWDSSEWPAPMPSSTNEEGKVGFKQEWREFDLTPRIREGVNFCARFSFQNPHGYWSSPLINWTWLMDYHTGDFSVDSEELPVTREPLTVSPNPVSAGRPVILDGLAPEAMWSIYDVLGRQMLSGSGRSLPTAGLSPGTYFVRVDGGKASALTVR